MHDQINNIFSGFQTNNILPFLDNTDELCARKTKYTCFRIIRIAKDNSLPYFPLTWFFILFSTIFSFRGMEVHQSICMFIHYLSPHDVINIHYLYINK